MSSFRVPIKAFVFRSEKGEMIVMKCGWIWGYDDCDEMWMIWGYDDCDEMWMIWGYDDCDEMWMIWGYDDCDEMWMDLRLWW